MIQIRHGIPEDLRDQAVALYWNAFGDKLGPVMGPTRRAQIYLRRVMRLHSAFAALDAEGRLVGIAGYRMGEGSFAGGTLTDLRAVYGRVGASWRSALLSRLARGEEDGRFLIDGISVAPRMRGRGLGTALIQALSEEARAAGYRDMRLEVVDSNLRARALYERLGFVATRTQSIGPLRHIFGFGAATTMIRPLGPP